MDNKRMVWDADLSWRRHMSWCTALRALGFPNRMPARSLRTRWRWIFIDNKGLSTSWISVLSGWRKQIIIEIDFLHQTPRRWLQPSAWQCLSHKYLFNCLPLQLVHWHLCVGCYIGSPCRRLGAHLLRTLLLYQIPAQCINDHISLNGPLLSIQMEQIKGKIITILITVITGLVECHTRPHTTSLSNTLSLSSSHTGAIIPAIARFFYLILC